VIAIAPGRYVEDVAPKVSLSLVGRCAPMVSLVNPGDANAGVSVAGVDVMVSGLTLRGHHQGVSVSQGGSATLTDSIVIANEGAGVRAVGSGSAAGLTRVRVAQTVADAASMLDGWGIRAEAGATITVTGSSIVGNTKTGISLDSSSAKVTGTLIVGTVPAIDGSYGQGIGVTHASTLTLETSAVVGCHSSGITAEEVGSDAKIHQSVVRGTLADGNGFGQGIAVANGASVELMQSLVAETLSAAVLVDSTSAPGAIATITASVLRGPIPARTGSWGPGALVQAGGALQINGSAIVGTSAFGLGLTDQGTTGAAQATAVIGTTPATVGGTCAGVIVQSSATLALNGSSLVGNTSLGLSAGSAMGGATVTAEGLFVQGTHPDSQGNFGSGAQCTHQGTLTLSRSAIVGNAVDGLSLAEASKVSVTGTVVRASVLDPNGHFGYGIIASNLGDLTLASSFVRDNPGVGLTFSDAMGTVSSTWVANNAVGILAQEGSFLTVGDPSAPLATGQVSVSADSTFAGNGSRVGSGTVALPPAPL
jgi:parallel beta helix pectate lyase-like protein